MLALSSEITLLTISVHLVVIALLSYWWYRAATTNRLLGGIVLSLWFGITLFFSFNNLLTDFTVLPPPMAIAMTIPVMLGLWLLFRVPTFQEIVKRLSLRGIIGIQVYRVIGAVFLLVWMNGEMASELSLTTGIMDVTVGISALVIALFNVKNRSLLIGWNVLGLADFAYSVTLSLFAAPTIIQLVNLQGVELLAQQPLSLISLWAVPLSILLHSFALYHLLQGESKPKSMEEVAYA